MIALFFCLTYIRGKYFLTVGGFSAFAPDSRYSRGTYVALFFALLRQIFIDGWMRPSQLRNYYPIRRTPSEAFFFFFPYEENTNSSDC